MLPLLDPETAENVPARQGVHAEAANDGEKNPGLQGVHALVVPEPTVEKLPDKHVPDQLDAPAKQKNPGGQDKQKELPNKWTNVPGEHFEHNELVPLPNKEKLPGPHSPLPLDELQPARQYAPAGQALHQAVVPLPATEKLPAPHSPLPLDELQPARQYDPAGHAKHALNALDPLFSLYVPAGHAVHDALAPLPALE